MIEFQVVSSLDVVAFGKKVEALLNDGYSIRKLLAVPSGNNNLYTKHIAYMTKTT